MLTRTLLLLLLFSSPALAFEGPPGCGKDCSSCHTLSSEEAEEMLKIKDVKVSDAPAKGMWQVDGTQNGNKVRVYVDFAKKHVMLINNFIPVENIGKPPEMKRFDLKDIPLSGTFLMGSKKAKKKVIVFDDPDCPYCKKLHIEIKKILEKRKDIAFYIKFYPLPMHPQAYEKSKAVLCSNSEKLLDDAFEGREVPKATCDTKAVDENIELAKKLGISGTPGIILPDGRLVPGFVEGEALLRLIDEPVK